MENKVKRATTYYGLDKENAEQEINRINKLRSNHYKYYTETDWKSPLNYDICINSDALTYFYFYFLRESRFYRPFASLMLVVRYAPLLVH